MPAKPSSNRTSGSNEEFPPSPSSPESSPLHSPDRSSLLFSLTTIAILGGSLLLRLLAARGELWLDEVWSLTLALKTNAWLEILTMVNIDNNHQLNTLWMHWLGSQEHVIVYRLPSVVLGTAAVALAGRFARSWGRPSELIVMLLMGFSYPMIHYASEARGYAGLLCFSFAALLALRQFMHRFAFGPACVFGVCCLLGVLSHVLFLQMYGAMFLWSMWLASRRENAWSSMLRVGTRAHLLPLIAFIFLYCFHLRYLTIAGGPARPWLEVLSSSSELFLGMPHGLMPGVVITGIMSLILLFGGSLMFRERRSEWLLFILVILIMPALTLLVMQPAALFERYFLLSGSLFLVLLGFLFAAGLRRKGVLLSLVTALIVLFLVGNIVPTIRLITDGRSHYAAIVAFMDQHSPRSHILVTGDQDFRHAMMLAHAARHPTTGKTIRYEGHFTLPVGGADWCLLHDRGSDQPRAEYVDRYGHRYVLRKSVSGNRLSGYNLHLYQARLDANASSMKQ